MSSFFGGNSRPKNAHRLFLRLPLKIGKKKEEVSLLSANMQNTHQRAPFGGNHCLPFWPPRSVRCQSVGGKASHERFRGQEWHSVLGDRRLEMTARNGFPRRVCRVVRGGCARWLACLKGLKEFALSSVCFRVCSMSPVICHYWHYFFPGGEKAIGRCGVIVVTGHSFEALFRGRSQPS